MIQLQGGLFHRHWWSAKRTVLEGNYGGLSIAASLSLTALPPAVMAAGIRFRAGGIENDGHRTFGNAAENKYFRMEGSPVGVGRSLLDGLGKGLFHGGFRK